MIDGNIKDRCRYAYLYSILDQILVNLRIKMYTNNNEEKFEIKFVIIKSFD